MRHIDRQIAKQILTFVWAISAVPALAEEPGGTFTGTLNGALITYQLWPMQSDFGRFGNTITVSMMTNRCEGDQYLGQISLGFEKYGETINAVEIRLFG